VQDRHCSPTADAADSWARRASALSIDARPFIDGSRVDPGTADTFDCTNPHTGRVLAQVPCCAQADIDQAVAAARRSLTTASMPGSWADRSVRAAALLRLADAVQAHGEELALLDSLCMGMPISPALADVAEAAGTLRQAVEALPALDDEALPARPGATAINRRMPHGVVGLVTPWNFPLFAALAKLGPALAAGNAVVLKPSELAPLSALRLADLAARCGMPCGVLNVVPGLGAQAGQALAAHSGVDALSFTGSTRTGQQIMQAAGRSNLKALMLECGGKSPQIVFDDFGDLPALADGLVRGFTWNSGQVCVAGSRILVRRELHDPLAGLLEERMLALHTGDPLDPATALGPLAGRAQWRKVRGHVRDALAGGARSLGAFNDDEAGACHFRPLVIGQVDVRSAIVQEEVFGPVATLEAFDTPEEAVALANATDYGLAATAWVEDDALAGRLAHALRAGIVTLMHTADPAPAGARGVSVEPVGLSGFGPEGGRAGLLAYTRVGRRLRLLAPAPACWPQRHVRLDWCGMDSPAAPRADTAADSPLLASCTAALAALGTPAVFDALFDLLRQSVVIDAFSALQVFHDKRPRLLADRAVGIAFDPEQAASTWAAYTEGPYLFDPIHQHFAAGAPSGLYRLQDIAPEGFIGTEFYERFIANHGNTDELDLLVTTTQGWAFLVMLNRGPGRPGFSAGESHALEGLLPFAVELLRKHSLVSPPAPKPERVDDLVQRKIDVTTQCFATSVLTVREHGVLRYLLLGYSSQSIADKLGIAEGTVKIHRRNIYQKLEIGSQAELFALFVQCIPLAEPEGGVDPLAAYQSRAVGTPARGATQR
jgi:acyl-CoA reductase-like NAD-dependent aldehyde dehydrogenase/DNA-binding CsgD family transcriptional regulator